MAQPDMNVLAASLNAIATEIPLLQNHPMMNIAAQLTQIQNSLQDLQTGQENLQTGQQNLQAGQQSLQIIVARNEHNSFARLCNSSISRIDSALMPLVDPNNQPIVGFPADVGQIQAYNGNTIDQLLTRFGLPVNGNVPERRARLFQYIGVSLF